MRISDWSSDVCSSDLLTPGGTAAMQPNMPQAGIDPRTLSFFSGRGGVQPGALPASLAGVAGQGGVVIEDPSGVTAALHSVTREQIQIGRAACRERVCTDVSIPVVAVSLQKKHTK